MTVAEKQLALVLVSSPQADRRPQCPSRSRKPTRRISGRPQARPVMRGGGCSMREPRGRVRYTRTTSLRSWDGQEARGQPAGGSGLRPRGPRSPPSPWKSPCLPPFSEIRKTPNTKLSSLESTSLLVLCPVKGENFTQKIQGEPNGQTSALASVGGRGWVPAACVAHRNKCSLARGGGL